MFLRELYVYILKLPFLKAKLNVFIGEASVSGKYSWYVVLAAVCEITEWCVAPAGCNR